MTEKTGKAKADSKYRRDGFTRTNIKVAPK